MPNPIYVNFVILTMLFTGIATQITDDACMYKVWPVAFGGSSMEYLTCMTQDLDTGFIYTGGST
jgi:hypothetical protein